MKRKIILTLILSAILLTACNKDVQSTPTEQSVSIAAETSAVTESTETQKTENVSEVLPKYDEKISENMRLFNFSKLNREGEYTAVHNPAVSNGIKTFVNGKIICSFCRITNSDGSVSSRVLRFYNTDSETIEETIPLPDNCRIDEFIGGGGDILCKAAVTEYVTQDGAASKEQYIITVKNDYSYEFSEYIPKNAALPVGGHNIAEWYLDIFDADRDMMLLEGRESDSDDGTFSGYRYYVYMFPIDENRFVYLTGGYEYTSCFGIYDFRTDTATDLDGTENLRPLGIHNGKIYSVLKPWDKNDSDIYVTDIETLETVKAMYDLTGSEYRYYSMPESGDYILYMQRYNVGNIPNVIGVIDPDTGEITKQYNIPYGDKFYSQMYLVDENTAVIISDNMDEALIIDITK